MSNLKNQSDYPAWIYYPNREKPPAWVNPFLQVVAQVKEDVSSASVKGLTSNVVLSHLCPGLKALGYTVEATKLRKDRIRRPVLFGESGKERVAYEVDAVNDALGVVVEIEAGRGARGNAVYRDLIRTSLIVDARYLALGVMQTYRHLSAEKSVSVQSYQESKAILDAIYASGRLTLPFEGILLFGY